MDPPQPSLYSLSLVSRAKTALQSAAVRAEKVLTDIKADLKIDRDIDVQSQKGTRRSTDRDIDADDDSSRSPTEVMEGSSTKKVGSSKPLKKEIPSSSVIKQLALAIESAKNFNSVNGLLSSDVESSNTKEKSGLSFSAVKSLVLRDKEDKEINSSICLLFRSDTSRGTIFAMERSIWIRPYSSYIVKGSSWCTARKLCC